MNRQRLIISLIVSPLATPLATGAFMFSTTFSLVISYYSFLTALIASYMLTPAGALFVFLILLKTNHLTPKNVISAGTVLALLSGIVLSHLYDEPLFTAWWLYLGFGFLNSLAFSKLYFTGPAKQPIIGEEKKHTAY